MNPSVIDTSESTVDQSLGPLRVAQLQRYGFAVLSVGVALGALLLLEHFHFRVPSALLLLFVVAIISWYGGIGPAVLAVVLSIISFYWYFVEPVRTIFIYPSQIPYFIIFVAFTLLLMWFSTIRRRGEEALCRLNRELRAISNCNQTLLRATDEQSLLQEICRIVCEEAGYRVAWVAYGEHDQAQSVRPAAWTGTDEGYLANLGITWADTERGGGPTGTAIRSGKTCCIQDFATDPRLAPWRESALPRDFRSGIALPLKDEHANAFGSLTIYAAQPNAFTSEEIRLLEELAGDLAFGIVTLRSRAARQRAEEALRESEQKYQELVEHANSIILHWRRDGRIIHLNEFGQRFFGYTESEIRGRHVIGTIVPQTDSSGWDQHTLMEGICTNPSAFEQNVNENMRRNGERVWIAWTNLLDTKGEGTEILSIGVDITSRKRAEEALQRSEAYLAEGQRLSHTGSWAWSAVTRQPIYFSEEMFRIFGFDPQEGVPSAETFWQRIHPEDRDHTRELLMKAAGGNMEYEHDQRIVLPDGTVKHIHAIGHPVLDEYGRVAEYVGTSMDVTDRKRAKQERERLRQLEADLAHINRVSMLGELVASVAHEVNQPLSGVVSNASACLRWLAGEAPNLEEARETARRIVRDGKRAGEVIARIRALTRRTATPREKLDLNETIREVLALVGDEAKRRSALIRTRFAEDLSPVLGDRVQLQQVVLNLVMNGIEAMSSVGERARVLAITTRNIDADQVQVSVEDSGIGIDPEKRDQIFGSFYTTKPGGMGMGLSISRSILEAHGGRLWAMVKDGAGTLFHFTLPKYHDEASHAGA